VHVKECRAWVAPTRERANARYSPNDVVNVLLKRSGRHTAADAPAWARTILDAFRAEDVRNLVFLPDTVMGRLLALAEEDPFFRLIGVHREEEAVGILSGLFLGNQRGAMLIQSSGLGNTLNALGSLAMAYHIPFPLLVSLRGELGEFNPAQLHMGRAVPGCLDALNIRHITLHSEVNLETILSGALKTCYTAEEPFGVLLSALLTGWKPEK
jgi:sulfopyruvate decarboxylase subunit alpha